MQPMKIISTDHRHGLPKHCSHALELMEQIQILNTTGNTMFGSPKITLNVIVRRAKAVNMDVVSRGYTPISLG